MQRVSNTVSSALYTVQSCATAGSSKKFEITIHYLPTSHLKCRVSRDFLCKKGSIIYRRPNRLSDGYCMESSLSGSRRAHEKKWSGRWNQKIADVPDLVHKWEASRYPTMHLKRTIRRSMSIALESQSQFDICSHSPFDGIARRRWSYFIAPDLCTEKEVTMINSTRFWQERYLLPIFIWRCSTNMKFFCLT